jgi:hypothetical protein
MAVPIKRSMWPPCGVRRWTVLELDPMLLAATLERA